MSRVLTCLLCRPSASGSLIILGEFTLNGAASKSAVMPAVADIRQVILQRGRLHFTNKDSVNFDGYVILAYYPLHSLNSLTEELNLTFF